MSNYRNEKEERLAELFKVLGHPHRLAILTRLVRCVRRASASPPHGGPLGACVAEAGQGLGLAPSTISHHVKELRQAGLVTVERRGRELRCRVNEKTLREAIRYLKGLASFAFPGGKPCLPERSIFTDGPTGKTREAVPLASEGPCGSSTGGGCGG